MKYRIPRRAFDSIDLVYTDTVEYVFTLDFISYISNNNISLICEENSKFDHDTLTIQVSTKISNLVDDYEHETNTKLKELVSDMRDKSFPGGLLDQQVELISSRELELQKILYDILPIYVDSSHDQYTMMLLAI